METAIASLLSQYGPLALFAVMYYILFKWTLGQFEKQENKYEAIIKAGAEREINYQVIITKLSEELPGIRETLARIEQKIT